MKAEINRDLTGYKIKTLPLTVKDMDAQTRRVTIMLSKFDNIDSDNDIIRCGAFSKSINERGPESQSNRKIAFLRHHDWEHQVGKWIQLEENADGLVGIGELGRSTKGNDALLDYQDGIILEHSIGFQYIPDKMNMVEQGDSYFFDIKEVAVWEGSAVTFGANSLTPTLDVSKGNKSDLLEKINGRMNAVIHALKNGKGTDDRLHAFEMQLSVLKEQYNSLINWKPSPVKEDTLDIEKPKTIEQSNSKLFYLTQLK